MRTLSSAQAAALLHINKKRIQVMARAGKLPAARVGRRWLFPAEAIERMLESGGAPGPAGAGLELSARNRLRGRITQLRFDGLMAEVTLRIGDQDLVSVITRSSAERLGLRTGDEVVAVIKSTEVMIGREGREP